MKHGDFTELAENYKYRPAYSKLILKALLQYVGYNPERDFTIAEVGAGTGKLTKMLLELGLHVTAVEPNDVMRGEGIKYTQEYKVDWIKGNGESTTLKDEYADWVVMASSFHWTDPRLSLPEFYRILKSAGYFTVMWNPRNIEASELHKKIEDEIYKIIPYIKRISSGAKHHTKKWEEVLLSTGHFKNVIFMEVDHEEVMSKEQYMGAWKSVNDIRVQAGEERWQLILDVIESEIKDLDIIGIPYKICAWTAQKKW